MLLKALCNRFAFASILGRNANRLPNTTAEKASGCAAEHFQIVAKTLRVMQLTAILLTVCSFAVSARSISQSITFSGKDVELEKVFNVIKQQTGYFVTYDKALLAHAKPVTIHADQMPLGKFIKNVLEKQSLTYTIVNTTIAVKEVSNAFNTDLKNNFNHPSFFIAQSPIKGYVTDGDGNALVGATITLKNSNISAKTTGDGSFVINANAGDILVISYVGYDVKEVKLGASSVKNGMIGTIEMIISPTALKGVEVNKGYYTQKQIENTGNVFTVKGEDLRKQPVTDPILALQGRVPGLSISQTSGVPGAPLKISLRGQNFIGGVAPANNNDPLYIVDGVPYTSTPLLEYMPVGNIISGSYSGKIYSSTSGPSPFNMLNSSDIETIDILKDADATAIYGSRGANGVILITTKKAKAGRTKIDLNISQGFSKQTVTPTLLNTQQYLEMRGEAFKNDGIIPNEYNYDVNGFWDRTKYTNWASKLMGKMAVYASALAGVSGGTANTQFNVSIGYNKTGTYVPGDYSDQRISSHFSLSHSSENKKFHIDFSGLYSNDNNALPSYESGYIAFAPDGPALYNKDGSLNWQPQGGAATWNNPVAYRFKHSQTNSNLLNTALSLRYAILKGLEVRNTVSYSTTYSAQMNTSPATVVAPPYNTDPNNRSLDQSSTNGNTWNNETQLNYHISIGKSSLDALAGFSFQNTKSNSIAFSANGFSSDALITNPLSAPSFILNYTNANQYKFSSIYGRVGYNWNQKYILNATLRNDGSSRFGPGKQFGTFGSIGVAWIFSNTELAKRYMSWVSLGKLRVSYGVTGSDGISDYSFLSRYDVSNVRYQNVTLLRPNSLTNPKLQWQQNNKFEAGLELGFVKDRINTTIVYYQNKSDDQLVFFKLPLVAGFGGVIKNLPALVRNAGWEFALQTFNVRSINFSWSSAFNLSFPKNRILSYPIVNTSGSGYRIGSSLFSIPVYHYLGVDPQTGIYQIASKNSSSVTLSDQIFSKPITQLFYGGLNNTINYKRWSLDLFFQFTKQNGYGWQKSFRMPGVGNEYDNPNQPSEVLKRWQKPGDVSNIQLFSTGQAIQLPINIYDFFLASDAVIVDASFVRLKNANLSYELPKSVVDRMHIQGLRVYFSGQNLFVITKYKVLDPETQNLLAPVKTFTAGINITL